MKSRFLEPYEISGKNVRVVVRLEGQCRCGGTFRSGEIVSGMEPGYVAIHSEPYCDQFRRLDTLDFLRWIRTGVEYPS